MKIPDDQQFTIPLGTRFNLTVPKSFRNHLKSKGIEMIPGELVTLAFVHGDNGGGTHQVKLKVGKTGGKRAKAGK